MVWRASGTRRMTADTFFDRPDDGRRYELTDGELEMAPAPGANVHQHTVREVFRPLDAQVRERRPGSVWFAPTGVVLSAYDVVQPDLLYVRADRAAIVGGRIHGAPHLVVEVVSASSAELDRGLKLRRYARFGVPWNWIVDPAARTVDELERCDGAYVRRARLEGDAWFEPALFPGLKIDRGTVWPENGAEAGELSDSRDIIRLAKRRTLPL